MKKQKSFVCIFLAIIMIISVIYPVFAAGINVVPDKQTYSSREEVNLSSDFEAENGIDWYYIDKNGDQQEILGDGKVIIFTIPENDTNQTVSTVVYSVYNEEQNWTTIAIEPNLEEITLTAEETSMYIYSYIELSADGYENEDLNFESSDESIATVDENGVVTGRDIGTVTITAISKESSNAVGEIEITVEDPRPGPTPSLYQMSIKDDYVETMKVGETQRLGIVLGGYDMKKVAMSSELVEHTSSDPEIADFTEYGVLEAKKAGTVELTLTTKIGIGMPSIIVPQTFSIEIEPNQEEITLTAEETSMYVYSYIELSADGYENTDLNFESSDENIATIDENGVVTGRDIGTVTITVASKENANAVGEIEITVMDPKPVPAAPFFYQMAIKDIYVETMEVGETQRLGLVLSGHGRTIAMSSELVEHTSSDSEVADFTDYGVLEAKKAGTVDLTLTTKVGIGMGSSIVSQTYTIEIEGEDTIPYQLAPKWTYKGDIDEFVVASDGSIYLSLEDEIKALNAAGTEKKGFNASVNGKVSIGNIDGQDYLFVVHTKTNTLSILDIDTGAIEGQVTMKDDIRSKPYVDSVTGNIYIVTKDFYNDYTRTLYALNKDLDKCLWKRDLGKRKRNRESDIKYTTSIDTYGDNVYVLNDYELWAFDNKGNKLWDFTSENEFESTTYPNELVIDQDTIYFKDTKKIYALNTQSGNKKWDKEFKSITSFIPVISLDGQYIYITAEDENGTNLFKINAQTGNDEDSYTPGGLYAVFAQDGYLYTSTNIYDENLNIVANYKDVLGNERKDDFHIGENGDLYRLIEGENDWVVSAIEAVELFDFTDKEATDIKITNELSVNMFPEEELDIIAGAANQHGAFLSNIELQWESDNETVATVVYGEKDEDENNSINATIIALKTGKANITIKVKDLDISKSIEVNVKESPVPQKMYFVYDHAHDTLQNPNKIESITGYAYESLPSPWIYIEDQYGNFMQKQKVEWSSDGISFLLYKGGSGDNNIKYQGHLNAHNPVETTLKASLVDYPEISCEIPVFIKPVRSGKVWTFNDIEYGTSDSYKQTFFTINKHVNTFCLTANGKLFAIDPKDGEEKWRIDGGGNVWFSEPIIDIEGSIYVYNIGGSYSEVYKYKHDGTLLEKTNEEFPGINGFKMGDDYIYVLTKDNGLYKLDKQLNRLWNDPVEIGEGDYQRMLLVNDKLYISIEGKIYEITEDGQKSLYYEDKYTELWLEGSTSDGDIIVQRNVLGNYSLLSLDIEGDENWRYEVLETKVMVGMDEDNNIYAVEYSKNLEKKIYFLNSDGTERVRNTFVDRDSKVGLKPIIGKDGTIYAATGQINAFSQEGELLWQSSTVHEDGFSLYPPPKSIYVDEENTLYASSYNGGMIALRGKPQTGTELSIEGKENISMDTFKDLELELTNRGEEIEFYIRIALEDLDGEKVISETFLEDSLKKNRAKNYNFGVKIPKEGNFRFKIEIIDRITEEVICSDKMEL